MSVTAVNRVRVVESADTSYDSSTFEVRYLVKTDDKDTPLSEVLGATGIPVYGEEFDEIPGAFCANVSGELEGVSRTVWNVRAEFTNELLQSDYTGTSTVYTWGTEVIRQTFTVDKNNNAIANTVGDPFIPALETDLTLLTLRVEREESSFAGGTITTYLNHTNASPVTISGYTIATNTGLMRKIGASYEPAKDVWKVTYDITIRDYDSSWTVQKPQGIAAVDNAWLRRVLNAGLREQEYAGAEKQVIIDKGGRQGVTQPVPLTIDGKELPQGDPEVWLGFKEFNSVNWGSLNL